MFRLYSKGCEYALRALIEACAPGKSDRFLAKDVCRDAGISESFTRKVFQSLVQAGFLEAVRGPGGGYVLADDPATISVLDVIRAVDGEDTFEGCLLGLPECGSGHPCPLHELWAKTKQELLDKLQTVTLLEMVGVAHEEGAGKDAT
jgi:Rrf2 family iron-sulfur cluster assembly transcriptional regulator